MILASILYAEARSQAQLEEEEGEEHTSIKFPGPAGSAVRTW
jgi:hypothetical protein